ncbi:transposase [Streptomyces chartreusis]|uniref:transposase n=1 Tax=Streptomyces chartreusis TaxID=1969 RepID=UPI0037FFC707
MPGRRVAAYASSRGRTLVDRQLYLPKSWTSDRDRCRAAGVPDGLAFATKTELARHLVTRALASPLPIAWVTADALYGQDWHFRRRREEAGLGYVVAVPKSQQVKSLAGCWRIDQLISDAPEDSWERLSCGDGAKGPRVRVLVHAPRAAWQRWRNLRDVEGPLLQDCCTKYGSTVIQPLPRAPWRVPRSPWARVYQEST